MSLATGCGKYTAASVEKQSLRFPVISLFREHYTRTFLLCLKSDYIVLQEYVKCNTSAVFNNMNTLENGKPIFTELSDITFYRYTNATKKMVACDAPGFKVDYSSTYALPRTGKNIVVTKFNDNGKKIQKTLKWNGRKFTK